MVCATITRDPNQVSDHTALCIRDGLHSAIIDVFGVEAPDVEIRIREIGPLDLNSPPLAIDIDSGPGKELWRIEACHDLLLKLSEKLLKYVEVLKYAEIPELYLQKGKSNIWLRIFARGASMPIGCPADLH